MLAGISDWPHAGRAYTDQAGTQPSPRQPLGDTTLQINDGMTYVGKYSGSVDIYSSDVPTGRNSLYRPDLRHLPAWLVKLHWAIDVGRRDGY